MADIVLINPRFEISFWGLEHVLPIMGKRANMPVGSLPLLAALTPAPHQVTLIDENVEAIDFERVARADIVGLTGFEDVFIGETITDAPDREPLPFVPIDPPTIQMEFAVNDGPLAGKEGKLVTARHIRARPRPSL